MSEEFFSADYFGHEPGERKSNYPAVGGYTDNTGAPVQFAQWVYDNLHRYSHKHLPVLVKPTDKDAPKILEVGCATGAAVRELRRHGINAYGVDLSSYILGKAGEDIRLYLYQADMTEIFKSQIVRYAPFDAVVSKDVLEHATEDTIEGILKDFGKLAPLQIHIVNTGQYPYQAFDGDKSHHIRWNLDQWSQLATDLDLKIIFKET